MTEETALKISASLASIAESLGILARNYEPFDGNICGSVEINDFSYNAGAILEDLFGA